MTPSFDRESLLPHSVEAEEVVLGTILVNEEILDTVVDKVSLAPEHFYNPFYQKIFSEMLAFSQSGAPINAQSMGQHLAGEVKSFVSNSERADGGEFLFFDLASKAPAGQNIEYYASQVKRYYNLRRIITACNETVAKAKEAGRAEPTDFIANLEQEFLDIMRDQDAGDGLVPAKEVLLSTLGDLEERIAHQGETTGVCSGFNDLDKITGGWQKVI